MVNAAYKFYGKLINIYKTQYNKQSEDQNNFTLNFIEDDLFPIPSLECDKVKLEPEETIAKIVKLNPWKRENEGTGLKMLTTNILLTRLPILSAQINARNNSYKLKSEIRQILSFVSA